jgi:hypothetical protein
LKEKGIDGANKGRVQLSDTEPLRYNHTYLVHKIDYKSIPLIAINPFGNTPSLVNRHMNVQLSIFLSHSSHIPG